MLNSILKVKGVQKLKSTEKSKINGGNTTACIHTCLGGHCIMGRCYYVLK